MIHECAPRGWYVIQHILSSDGVAFVRLARVCDVCGLREGAVIPAMRWEEMEDRNSIRWDD